MIVSFHKMQAFFFKVLFSFYIYSQVTRCSVSGRVEGLSRGECARTHACVNDCICVCSLSTQLLFVVHMHRLPHLIFEFFFLFVTTSLPFTFTFTLPFLSFSF
ncbi:hypothetical protein, unlikely [Trypanosoma brucei gambiense DAL972]|uniref:T. brucei spp.-specific protein n=1 Tax=Trypanosoma brucei gambiense (strain MHOM/CI/86/DAL972) TaxID=679716 RepID=C9ZZE6_TRYB9|nr:hypothetical protein, unlikely [Trypanosoma brucei gambiense DAL972]CBH14795.1 hypothetical protein, unlikely [Trypanosoma brucei gambiense DAL972]|eukprot:XP_011777061.1 hypothetical protein, unlikely [Trypanosoma brucei gambiense DAL972]